MDVELSRGAQRPAATNIDMIAQNVQLLSEKVLQDLAKGQLVKLAVSCEDSQ